MNITPQNVVLTSGQGVTFEATDATGQPVAVSWNVNPAKGSLVTPAADANTPTRSATYLAPPLVSVAETIVLIVKSTDDSASATISLTPDYISVFPPKVDLRIGQSQKFDAHVAGAPSAPRPAPPVQAPPPPPAAGRQNQQPIPPDTAMSVTWNISPKVGTLDENGKYTAPDQINDSVCVTVIARLGSSTNHATVNLVPNPWTGWRVHALGAYLLAIFSLVFLLIGFWPPVLPTPEVAKAERLESEKVLKDQTDTLKVATVEAKSEEAAAAQAKAAAAKAAADKAQDEGAKSQTASVAAARAEIDGRALAQVELEQKRDKDDLDQKRKTEELVKDPNVKTLLRPCGIGREIDLILLVLLSGALGSFLHAARSFADFLGNERLKQSWAWWYCMAPFTGAILALVFYAAIRGGFLAINAGTTTKASDLNPYGVAGVAFIVGMFSKPATTKLGEVFQALFNTDKAKETKDTLKAELNPATTDVKPPSSGSTGNPTPPPKP
jgi:hypothetical protein